LREDQQVESQVHHRPRQRRNALDDEVRAERHVTNQAVPRERRQDAKVLRMFVLRGHGVIPFWAIVH
jgi:hypothetical protein